MATYDMGSDNAVVGRPTGDLIRGTLVGSQSSSAHVGLGCVARARHARMTSAESLALGPGARG